MAQPIFLSLEEIEQIGVKVFKNECAGKNECLLEWNEGEGFLSLGIGHFIWYPQGVTEPFEESFPVLIKYLKEKGIKLPAWLDQEPFPTCPWITREDFIKNKSGFKAQELYKLLSETKSLQSAFLVSRLDVILSLILENVDDRDDFRIKNKFKRLASTPQGIFVLVDYANFKGLGISLGERYQEQGWGLVQVLSRMKDDEQELNPVEEFVKEAQKILTERVNNAPVGRQEQKWLLGWQNRVNSYLKE